MDQREEHDLIEALADITDRLRDLHKQHVELSRSLAALLGAWCAQGQNFVDSYNAQMRCAEQTISEHLADDLDEEYGVLIERLRKTARAHP